jgi:hypothetical protein
VNQFGLFFRIHEGHSYRGITHGRIQGEGAGGAHSLPAESALFCRRVQFSNHNFPQKRHSFIAQKQNFPQKPSKALVHCTKPNIFPRKKNAFFATRKDVESYTQMPGKCILALEFSNFSGEWRSSCVPFFRGCTRSRNPGSAPVT